MELSISIVSYNTKDNLRECLDSILKNVKNVEYEIIVVDNGSTDGSPNMVQREFPNVRLKENKTNTFFTLKFYVLMAVSKLWIGSFIHPWS
ncbi:MAG: glycosyltransferase [Candidatus Stahlbacteria bacterium]|nr:glycosyltransferase [Candidatus Stahlbacteria bacterium]